jgi:hypothetical protein
VLGSVGSGDRPLEQISVKSLQKIEVLWYIRTGEKSCFECKAASRAGSNWRFRAPERSHGSPDAMLEHILPVAPQSIG